MQTPTRNTDIYGNAIVVGTRVRSFDFPYRDGDEIDGMDLEGPRASYMEGVVVDYKQHEGCERYVIDVTKRMCSGEERPVVPEVARIIPPVNGVWGSGRTFGVVAIVEASA